MSALSPFNQRIQKLAGTTQAKTTALTALARKRAHIPTNTRLTKEQEETIYADIKSGEVGEQLAKRTAKDVAAVTAGPQPHRSKPRSSQPRKSKPAPKKKPELEEIPQAKGTELEEIPQALEGEVITDAITIKSTADSTFEEIGAEGIAHSVKSAEFTIRKALCVELVYDKCQAVAGGTEFSGRIKELWGMDSKAGSGYLCIAKASRRLSQFPRILSSSVSGLLEMAKFDEGVFLELAGSEAINADMTAKELKDLRIPPKEPTDPTLVELQAKMEKMVAAVERLQLAIDNWKD